MKVDKIEEKNLCLSCEVCNASCPTNAIEMKFEGGQFLPHIDEEECIECGLCFKSCPAKDFGSFENLDNQEMTDDIAGDFIGCYSAYCKDLDLWENSTSGGLITLLLIKLLEDDKFDGAFVLSFDTFEGEPARLELAETKGDLKSSSKSKYLPASVYNVIKTLEEEKNPNYVIVGTPCQIRGIKNYIEEKDINDENLLFFGLFCDKTLNFNFIPYLEKEYAKNGERIRKLDYRNKERDGWPGHVKIYFDSGREIIIDREERMKVKKYFQLERCLYCMDKLNKSADISFGDCYILGKETPGRSSIIIRTEKGKGVWEEYKHLFNWEESGIRSIQRSQSLYRKKENLKFLKSLSEDNNFLKGAIKDKKVSQDRIELSKRQKYIKWGKNRKFSRIKFFSNLPDPEITKEMLKSGIWMGKAFFSDISKNIFQAKKKANQKKSIHKGENIIILGGELFNKGAQAMTFSIVDEMKNKFPEKEIYLFSRKDFHREEKEKEIYDFKIKPWSIGTKINLISSNNPIDLERITYPKHFEEIKEIIENSSFFIDVSGYSLSSQAGSLDFLASIGTYSYILDIMIAKRFNKPFYIFPQSIGPFRYPIWEKFILYPLLNYYLKYPEKVFVREKAGVKSLKKFTDKNVSQSRDIVLQKDEYNIDNIFKEEIELEKFDLPSNSVGIIPNSRVMERIEEEKIYSVYKSTIKKLLKSGKKIYILRHSNEDFSICKEIKELFPEEENVKLITKNLNAIELESIIDQFDFVIASRYHSIVHAYKNTVPALVIGWAVKYYELLKDFDQLDYFFDSRKEFSIKDFSKSLSKLLEGYEEEKGIIEKNLGGKKEKDIFSCINSSTE